MEVDYLRYEYTSILLLTNAAMYIKCNRKLALLHELNVRPA